MILRLIIYMVIISAQISATELPLFTIVKDVLEEPEIKIIQQLTENPNSNFLWYGRYNFWREDYLAEVVNNDKNISFTYPIKHECHSIIDKLSNLFLIKLKEFGVDITNRQITLESYLDRNVVDLQNADSSGMFWHRDSILVDGKRLVADYSMIILISGKTQEWEGANLILQLGGEYSDQDSYIWINSEYPQIILTPCYNQAIIFKNSNSGHMVTALTPLTDSPVLGDVFIITCYLKDQGQ